MNRFAALLDRLAYQPQRNEKLRLLRAYFSETTDPDRGYALAALTGSLDFTHAKPALLRGLVQERVDPVLFELSYDYVGDLAETTALIWPAERGANRSLTLSELVDALEQTGKAELPGLIARWLDGLDANGRWALIKFLTGGLRVGVSARLAKTAVAGLGDVKIADIEEMWHGLAPPFEDLFAWVEGKGPKPAPQIEAPFRPVMLAQALDDSDLQKLDASDFRAEWKWDGIRVQAAAQGDTRRLYSRTGEDISRAFPDLLETMDFDATLDGELLVMREGAVAPFGDLQKRLNRKSVSKKLMASHPVGVRAYDLLTLNGEDVRTLPFDERRHKLEEWIAKKAPASFDLSPLIDFGTWDDLAAKRNGELDPGVEGVMIKLATSPYTAGRAKGPWFKWKRDPYLIDAVLLYAQRGHGKRSSFYSDYTFGVWRTGDGGDELVPVGKAYFGFTDEELKRIDKFVRDNTINRFGPVREVSHDADHGLVLEVAFEGLNRSTRHKSGLAMRFPRVHRLRWDKPPAEADRIEALEALLPD